ncbi:Ran-binding protein 3 [Geodia barretti]|uniref:Ran-binding protein 3 n=1 Tax=Geodia barretti TaxID=519541 RepID=A0AA35SBT7_GEOBA|nr:Ran-binding protein 3 [Geodia barretti]
MEETGEKEKNLKRSADTQPAKKPALSSGFSFRPSPLHKATQGLILRQSTLTPPSTSGSCSVEKSSSAGPSTEVGFLKLDNSELNPILASSASSPAAINGRDVFNHTAEAKTGSFSGFIQSASTVPTFSSLSSMTGGSSSSGSTFGRVEGGREVQPVEEGRGEEGKVGGGGEGSGGEEGGVGESKAAGAASSSSSVVPVLLPEVQRVTGEEGEMKIVQINARLYAFDAATHSWKERGRGDIRLNDSCQSEGLFQSRLVMRASGSYRVLFNTHLWAEMKCERANQKSIRITAQDRDDIAVFLITGNNKDIQQLFSAVDHRIEALRLNAQHSSGETNPAQKEGQSRVSRESSPLDEEDKDSGKEDTPSSPESTVESHFREKAVSLLSEDNASGCEEEERGREEEREGEEREEGEREPKQSEDPQETSSTVSGTK